MAGKRHHILPRFLLKGFASNIVRDTVLTWVYRREGKVFEASTADVAVEKDFYGKEGGPSVDDEITEIEPDFASLLDELRRTSNGYEIRDSRIAEFVGHLSSRTKHIRDSLVDSSEFLIATLFEYLADQNNFRAWILEYYKRHPEVIKQEVDKAVEKMQLPRHQRMPFRQRLLTQVRPERLVSKMDKQISEYSFMFSAVGPILLQRIPGMVKDGHIKTLAKSLIAEPRLENYRLLNWFVCECVEPLVLGDVGCLFEVAGAKKFKSLDDKEDELRAVYLPISSTKLVVGSPSRSIPRVDCTVINENSAKCSRDYFVCQSSEMLVLLPLLGTESEVLSREEIKQLVMEVILEE